MALKLKSLPGLEDDPFSLTEGGDFGGDGGFGDGGFGDGGFGDGGSGDSGGDGYDAEAAAAAADQNIFTLPATTITAPTLTGTEISNIFEGQKTGGEVSQIDNKAVMETGGTTTTTTTTDQTGIPVIRDPNTIGADGGGAPQGSGLSNVLRTDITYVTPSGFESGQNQASRGIYVSPEEAAALGIGRGATSVFDPGSTLGLGYNLVSGSTLGGSPTSIRQVPGPTATTPTTSTGPTDAEKSQAAESLIDQRLKDAIAKNPNLTEDQIKGLVEDAFYEVYGPAGVGGVNKPAGATGSQGLTFPAIIPISIPGISPTAAAILSAASILGSGGNVGRIDLTDPLGSLINLGKGIVNTGKNIFMGPTAPGAPAAGTGTVGTGTIVGGDIRGTIDAARAAQDAADKAAAEKAAADAEAEAEKKRRQDEEAANARAILMGTMGSAEEQRAKNDEQARQDAIAAAAAREQMAELQRQQAAAAAIFAGKNPPGTTPPVDDKNKPCPEPGHIRDANGNCGPVPYTGPTPTGPAGSTPNVECKEGMEMVNGQCVPKCGAGETRDASGACVKVSINTPPPPPPEECKEGMERVNGQCVAKCGDGFRRDSTTGQCVPIATNVPTTPTTPTTPTPSTTPGTYNFVFTPSEVTPSTYTTPTSKAPAQRYTWEEASTQIGAMNAPTGRRFLGYELGENGQPVPIYSKPSGKSVAEDIVGGYGQMAKGMTQADLDNLFASISKQTGVSESEIKDKGYQNALTDAAAKQTEAANRALRRGNLADAAEFGMQAKQLREMANPQLYGETGTIGQYATTAQNQVARDIESLRAAERGELSPEAIRNAQQAAREAFGARGRLRDTGAMAQEILNREAAVQQRQQLARQNLAQSMGQLGQGIGYQTANVFDPMAAALGQQYGMQTSNVGLNQALYNQAMGMAAGQGGYGFAQQMYNPFSNYAADVYGTNVNAINAAQIAEANRLASLEAARMGQDAAAAANNARMAMGGLDLFYKLGMANKWFG